MRKLIFSIAMFVPLLAISQPMQVSRAEAEQAAVKAVCLTYNDYSTRHLVVSNVVERRFGENVALYEVIFETGESAIISGGKAAQPIVAVNINASGYSWLDNPEGRECGLLPLLENKYQSIGRCFSNDYPANDAWNILDSINTNNRSQYGPYLNTLWGQDIGVDCDYCMDMYNKYMPFSEGDCPECQNEDRRYPSGCTITALAQLMNYWKYPVLFNGTEQIDWCNMPKRIKCGESTEVQNEAVARLYKILVDTYNPHFGSLIDNTDNTDININRCYGFLNPANTDDELQDVFGYSNEMSVRARMLYNSTDWKSMIYSEIIAGRPVLYWAFETNPFNGAHTFVCDGYNDATGLFHFNFGNWDDAWCSIDNIVEGEYHWAFDECAMIKIRPGEGQYFCSHSLCLEDFYDLFYGTHNLSTCNPYDVTPRTMTRLTSSSVSYPSVYRTIPSGASASYQAHEEVLLRDGFSVERGAEFVAKITPCPNCENNRNREEDIGMYDEHEESSTEMSPNIQANARKTTKTPANLYPNPTDGELTMNVDGEVESVVIFDVNGFPQGGWDFIAITDEWITINVQRLKAGAYILKVRHPDGNTETAKFLKK